MTLPVVTAPDGRQAKLLANAIVVHALRSTCPIVASSATHDFYDGKEPGALLAVERPADVARGTSRSR